MTDELLCNLGLVDRKRNTDRDQMILVSLQCHWELGTGQLGKFPTRLSLTWLFSLSIVGAILQLTTVSLIASEQK